MSKNLSGKRPLLDSNVFIERSVPESTFLKMYLSSVVLYELVAANVDDAQLNIYLSWAKTFGEQERLITPSAVDWLECSKLIRNLLRGSKSKTTGYVKKITSAQQQQNDALIARSTALNDCFLITSNVRDFEKFKPYMSGLVIVPADDYFDG
jgi:predicted nucleic acid-binding protein